LNSGALHITHQFSESDFELLFKEHFKPLCFLAQRYVKDLDMAREIVQESFMSLWVKRESIDSSKSVKPYLSTSVHNKCLNYLRDSKKFDKDLMIAEHLMTETGGELTDVLVVKDISKKIDEAIAELPEKCREIFIMNRYEHLKYHEIAQKLDISQKTVEAQMSKALQHMRVRLAEYIPVILLIMYYLKK
jgi:RNA polymerase sigma-70 factor, ECF subfamily